MKKIVAILGMLAVSTIAHGAKQTVNNGETMGQARTKINSNFTELYSGKADASCFASESAFNACFDLTWTTGGTFDQAGNYTLTGTWNFSGATVTGLPFLSLTNTTAFTPDADYEPATKKYVDDAITAGGGYTDEMAQDAVGGMFSGNTETGIAITYDDATAKINAVVDFSSLSSVYQPLDSDLTTWAGITPGTGIGTWLATPSGANLASALTTALPASKGGTGLTALGTGVATAMGNAVDASGGFITYDADLITAAGASAASNGTYFGKNSGGTVGFHALPSGSTAAGSDTQVQFNDGGTSFGGDAGMTYNKTTDSLTVVGTVTAGAFATSAADGSRYSALPNNTSAPAAATVVDGVYTYNHELYGVENSGTASKLLMANDIGASGGVQAHDADLEALAAPTAWRLYYSNGSSAQTALSFGALNTFMISGGASAAPSFYDMTTSINSGAPNGTGAKIHWSQLTGVPAGFADGSDDGAGGGITHASSDGTYYASRNGAWSAFTSGNYTLSMTLTGNTAVTLPTSGTLITSDSTVTKTNLTLDVEGTGNSITIVDKVWFAAAGCNNATATSFYDLPTSGAPSPACITGTNTQKGVLDFNDTTPNYAQVSLALPSDWTGNLDLKYKWLASATTGDVVWAVQTACVADAETDDPSWNTASTVTDAAKGTTLQTNDAILTSITATGCAAGELLHLRFYRDAANGSDTMTGNARLIGAEVTLRRAQ